MSHAFILQSGTWLGEGKITFNNSPDSISFYTKWTFNDPSDGTIIASQEVEMMGVPDKVQNQFLISDISDESFIIQLENEDVGMVIGKGVIDEKAVAWEFRESNGFEGYEVFTKSENDEYTFHAEYASTEQFRTIIDGRIWKKSP